MQSDIDFTQNFHFSCASFSNVLISHSFGHLPSSSKSTTERLNLVGKSGSISPVEYKRRSAFVPLSLVFAHLAKRDAYDVST